MATQPTEKNDIIEAQLGTMIIDGLTGIDLLVIDYHTLTRNISYSGDNKYSDGRLNSLTFYNFERWNILGGNGEDYLSGGNLDDTLIGGNGWDTLASNGGADSVDGGNGVDTWKANWSTLTSSISIILKTGNASISLGNLAVPTLKNIEALNVTTGSGSDTVSVGNNLANDVITTNGGNDSINVGIGGSDYVNGGDGSDLGIFDWSFSLGSITVNPYYDDFSDGQGRYVNFDNIERFQVTGGAGNDYLAGDVLNDSLLGGAGRDTLDGSRGNDSIDGGEGIDVWKADYSTATKAIIIKLSALVDANEVSSGLTGAVTRNIEQLDFSSGSGADLISVGSFSYSDTVYSNGGNDSINIGNGGRDYVNGGEGVDIGSFTWSASQTDITVNPYYDDFADGEGRYVNFDNVERFSLKGGSGNDHLAGDVYADSLTGGDGNDTLEGASGGDLINGGNGVDVWQADYHSSTANISIELSPTAKNQVLAGIKGALVSNIERLNFQSGTGNDLISTHSLAYDDVVRADEGEDAINVGTGGQDYVDGGAGLDVGQFDWSASTTAIVVNPYYDDYSDLEGRSVNFDNVERFNLKGGVGNDHLAGDAWNDSLSGGEGNDTLEGGGYRSDLEAFNIDVIDGGVGIDVWSADYLGSPASLNIQLSSTLNTNIVSDGISEGKISAVVKNIERLSLSTGAGNDQISAGSYAYDDVIRTGDGDDEINVGTGGQDYVDAGAGIDLGQFDWSTSTTTISVNPYYDDYSDLEGHSVNFDNVERFNLTGGSGNDYLAGDVYVDTLIGGAGDDELDGTSGGDQLTGGLGADIFDVRSNSGELIITDFAAGQGLEDVVKFINSPFAEMSFTRIQQNLQNVGQDTVLTLSDMDSLRFIGVSVTDFVADDFLW